jgi:hypothetical protein
MIHGFSFSYSSTLPLSHSLSHSVPEAEVVQLTRSHDGIWRVPTSPASDPSFPRTTQPRTWQPQRLSPSGGQRYASTGRLQASSPTPGLMIDLYV